jgi:hypothetical protein
MGMQHVRQSRRWALPLVLLAAIAACGLISQPIYAGPLDKLDTSLQWVPADAATYSSSLRLGEQVEIVAKSRAWAAVKGLPATQRLVEEINKAFQSPQGMMAKMFMASPEFKKGLAFLGDMFSREVFIYADPAAIDAAELFQKLNTVRSFGQLTALASGEFGPGEAGRAQAQLMLATLAENIELLKVPNVIIGFRVKDQALASQQIANLQGGIKSLSEFAPGLAELVKRQKLGDGDYLTFTVSGSMIPWDELPVDALRQMEASKGDVDKIIDKVKKTTLVLALGVRKDYVLLAIGPSMDCLAQLGKGPSLAGVPEMKKLEKFADRRIVAISYVSKAMAERMAFSAADVDGLVRMFQGVVKESRLTSDQKAKVEKDIRELGNDLKRLTQKAGAVVGASFLTDGGMETYSYAWGEHSPETGAKPLGILSHLGGQPILAIAGRGRSSVGDYDLAVKWIKKAHGYFEEFALPEMRSEDRETYKKVMEKLRPLAQRCDAATRNKLIPALADGQIALVLDARLKSQQFLREMPKLDKAMPMIEPALVLGVSNAEQLKEALAEYREIWNAGVEVVQEFAPPSEKEAIARFKLPKPESAKSASGAVYCYPPPADWGLDKQFALCLGLSDRMAAFTISNQHAERLLKATPLAVGGVLSDTSRPLAMAVSFDWAGLVDAATPWIELGVTELVKTEPEVSKFLGSSEPGKPSVMEQVRTVLDVLKTMRSITMESHLEDGVLVSHSLVEIRDIGAPASKN